MQQDALPTSGSLVITRPQMESAQVALRFGKAEHVVNLVSVAQLLCEKTWHSHLPDSALMRSCLSTILTPTGTCMHTFFCDWLECCCGQGGHMVKKLPASFRNFKASGKASYNSLAKPSQAAHRAYTSTRAALPTCGAGMNTNTKVPGSANTWRF